MYVSMDIVLRCRDIEFTHDRQLTIMNIRRPVEIGRGVRIVRDGLLHMIPVNVIVTKRSAMIGDCVLANMSFRDKSRMLDVAYIGTGDKELRSLKR